jgi:DnaJ-domain-containing protein 1
MACEPSCGLCDLYPWLCILGAFVVFFPVIFIVCAYISSWCESTPKNVANERPRYNPNADRCRTELLKSRLQRFDLSEEEMELLFGKEWRNELGSWNFDLFYKIVQMKLDLTKQSKSFRKKVSHIIDKVIRIIDSVWIEYSQEVKQFEKLCNDQIPGSYAWLEREWEFFKKYKKPSSEYSENTLDASEAYEILGLSITATLAQVKKRYRELALKHHPDKNEPAIKTKAEKKFVRINQAYETIMGAA